MQQARGDETNTFNDHRDEALPGVEAASARLYRLLAASGTETFVVETTPAGRELLNALRRSGRTDVEIRELLAMMTAEDLREMDRLRMLIVALLAEDSD